MVKEILKGHFSPETAYVVDDYPYGFRLRCKIRYWLETNKHGTRLVSATTNPKREGEVWNKPKASTYAKFGGCMYLDENDHVTWSGLTEYTDAAEAKAWVETYGAGLDPLAAKVAAVWVAAKEAYEKKRDEGKITITVTSGPMNEGPLKGATA